MVALSGCTNTTSVIRMVDNKSETSENYSVVWTSNHDDRWRNFIWVEQVDGKEIDARGAPVEIWPGPHTVQIRHRRDTFCFGASLLGPACFWSNEYRTIEWQSEPGRSYLPSVAYTCNKSWLWIEDTGRAVAEELALWRSYKSLVPEHEFSRDVRSRDKSLKRVIAGERPPDKCISQIE